jgi:hypothetical protein
VGIQCMEYFIDCMDIHRKPGHHVCQGT